MTHTTMTREGVGNPQQGGPNGGHDGMPTTIVMEKVAILCWLGTLTTMVMEENYSLPGRTVRPPVRTALLFCFCFDLYFKFYCLYRHKTDEG